MTSVKGIVDIKGKSYRTVAHRVNEFRTLHTDKYGILTEIVTNSDVVVIKAFIIDREQFVIATGFAEERRGSSQINKTSALENCETSAIGRALANFGLGGEEYASANEVQQAIHQQATPAAHDNSKIAKIRANSNALGRDMAAIFKDVTGKESPMPKDLTDAHIDKIIKLSDAAIAAADANLRDNNQ